VLNQRGYRSPYQKKRTWRIDGANRLFVTEALNKRLFTLFPDLFGRLFAGFVKPAFSFLMCQKSDFISL
jgi:hypothetical protein